MNQKDFKNLFDKYTGRVGYFTIDEWNDSMNRWQKYYDLITSQEGLPLDRWLKNDKGYLPDFLDTQVKGFGHARIGNYDQVMIYKYTGRDTSRKNKIIDKYNNLQFDDPNDVEKTYKDNIQSLLKKLANAASISDIFKLEKDNRYQKFSCKQILRKIPVLVSLMSGSNYPNAFMWFFNNNSLNSLAEILDVEIDDNDTFLQVNNVIYRKAIDWSEINTSEKNEIIKLYSFLLYLSDPSYHLNELESFYNKNIIFNGAPGTGKTYGVKKGIERLQSLDKEKFKDDRYIQFHPSYTYQDFIEGIKPLGIKDGNLDLHVTNGSFKDFCINVRKQNEDFYKKNGNVSYDDYPHYYFVVDEINRGNLSNIFGETFTLLESDYRDYDFSGKYENKTNCLVSTPLSNVIENIENEGEKKKLTYKEIDGKVLFGIPFNIHFIGIMNDVDRSIDAFDLALRRRFKWITKKCDYDVIKNMLLNSKYEDDSINEYIESCEKLNKFICNQEEDGLKLGSMYEIGHSFFLKVRDINKPNSKTISKKVKKAVFTHYIEGTLKEYIRQVADETEIDNWIKKAEKAFGID